MGTAWGQHLAGQLDGGVFALALLATGLVHAGANVLNDVGDDLQGSDRINVDRIGPYTGGSQVIQAGIRTRAEMTRIAAVLLALAAVAGLLLALRRGPLVFGFGAAGLLLAWAYSLPPANLASRGLGELAVGLAFGVLPVCGAAWLQVGRLDAGAAWLGLAVGGWVTAILLINEVPDIRADAAVGKRTLAVRFGRPGVAVLYALAFAVAPAATLAGLAVAYLPAAAFIVAVLLLAPAALVVRTLLVPAAPLRDAIRHTLAAHAAGCAGLVVSVVFG